MNSRPRAGPLRTEVLLVLLTVGGVTVGGVLTLKAASPELQGPEAGATGCKICYRIVTSSL